MASLPDFRGTAEQRFWQKVAKTEGCWLWTSPWKKESGYGLFMVSRERKAVLAHRFAWELTHGSIPEGMHVLHHCDVRACVNPEHLYVGTHQDNMRDRTNRGRASHVSGAAGERHACARLTDAQVQEIRDLRAQGWLQRDLADKFGVYPSHISNIVNNKVRVSATRGRTRTPISELQRTPT